MKALEVKNNDVVVGLIGTGKIGSAVAMGLSSENGWQPKKIILSSRTQAKADLLKKTFPHKIDIAKTNQEIIDKSDILLIGLLPQVAKEELPKLKFHEKNIVISMMATISYEEFTQLVQPVPKQNIVRTVPLTSASKRSGPILAYPENAYVKEFLKKFGTPVMVTKEDDITTLV